jgi:hypothetical protein
VRYKVGAEQLQQVPSLIHRPDTVFQAARTAPVGPTHAVSAATGAVACGIKADRLQVLDQDWETDCFTKENESSWIFEPHLTCTNALWRVQNPGFALISGGVRSPGRSGGSANL